MTHEQRVSIKKKIIAHFKDWEVVNVGTNILRVFNHPHDIMVDVNMVKYAYDNGYMEEYLNGLIKE